MAPLLIAATPTEVARVPAAPREHGTVDARHGWRELSRLEQRLAERRGLVGGHARVGKGLSRDDAKGPFGGCTNGPFDVYSYPAAMAFDFSRSNSPWLMVPASSRALAFAISSVELVLATLRM
ncbi:hypothetical protein QFZ26_001418 [Agromyces ramosus]|uniref:Uncharacterized protein n=1 Tax=Agromyces ramosus TaxID=33879 RepID=A0ABU0R705_9MICO|nr:hypothetical protein [Agromyces ramosus]